MWLSKLFCLMWTSSAIFLLSLKVHASNHDHRNLPDLPIYVITACHGDIFNFDCGAGHKIRPIRDFFGTAARKSENKRDCQFVDGDCTVVTPRSNSLLQRYCVGERICSFYQAERHPCGNGLFTNYHQIEYQCVPDNYITVMCGAHSFKTKAGYLMSPNFPNKYKPNVNCKCRLKSTNGGNIHIHILFLSIHFQDPCSDWLKINGVKRCGFATDVIEAPVFDLEFHTDNKEHHSGYWLYFKASGSGSVNVECDNFPISGETSVTATTTSTTTTALPITNIPTTVTTTTSRPTTTTSSTTAASTLPTTLTIPSTTFTTAKTTKATTTETKTTTTTSTTTTSATTMSTVTTAIPTLPSTKSVDVITNAPFTIPPVSTSVNSAEPSSSKTPATPTTTVNSTVTTISGVSIPTTDFFNETVKTITVSEATTSSSTGVIVDVSGETAVTPSTQPPTTTNATAAALVGEKGGLTLLGLIFICVAIAGLMFIILILGLIFWCRRKRVKNEETQTSGNASATVDVVVTKSEHGIEENCDTARLVANTDESTQSGNGFVSLSRAHALVIVESASHDGNAVATIHNKAVQVNLGPEISYDDNVIIIGRAEFEIDSVANLYSRIRHKDKGIQIGVGLCSDIVNTPSLPSCVYEDVQIAPKAAKRSSLQRAFPAAAEEKKQKKNKHKRDQTEYLELPVLNTTDINQSQGPVSCTDHVRKKTRRGPPKRMDYLNATLPEMTQRSNVSTDQVRKRARKNTAKRIAKITKNQNETESKAAVSTENVKQKARTVSGRRIKAAARRRSSSSGIDICTPIPAASTVDGFTSDEYQTSISSHGMTSEDLASDLDGEISGSDTSSHFETNSNRKASVLSLSVVDEMIMSPETPDNSGSDSDWDKKSAISI